MPLVGGHERAELRIVAKIVRFLLYCLESTCTLAEHRQHLEVLWCDDRDTKLNEHFQVRLNG